MHIYLAPLHGITDSHFRVLFKDRFGPFDYAVTPFVSTVSSETIGRSHFRDVMPQPDRPDVVSWTIPQMMGRDWRHLLSLARELFGLGYAEVNWNLGCPFDRVTRKKRGSGLLPHPDLVVEALDSILPHIAGRFSLKLRLGLSERHELQELLPRIEGFPLSCLIIHPRTASQQYSGSVDLAAFSEALASTSHTVIYSGDIRVCRDIDALSGRFGSRVGGYMIGRGAISDPFLPSRCKSGVDRGGAARVDAAAAIREFHDELHERRATSNGSAAAMGSMKQLWHYWYPSFRDARVDLELILRSRTVAEYRGAVDQFFDCNPLWDPQGSGLVL
jgi:tRNA-dihydrouridine synthase B